MTLPNLPPLKPTGGKIMVSLAIGFAAAGACTQFLSLNMPFGGARATNAKRSTLALERDEARSTAPRGSARGARGFARRVERSSRRRRRLPARRSPPIPTRVPPSVHPLVRRRRRLTLPPLTRARASFSSPSRARPSIRQAPAHDDEQGLVPRDGEEDANGVGPRGRAGPTDRAEPDVQERVRRWARERSDRRGETRGDVRVRASCSTIV